MCWKSAIYLLPVCVTYGPRKCTTLIDPHGDNFHQFWSWYDHPSYSVLAADTLHDLVALTFDLLTLNGTWQVTWGLSLHAYMESPPEICPPSLKILCVLILELWLMKSFTGYCWHCVFDYSACAVSCDLLVGGKFCTHIWNPHLRFVYSLCNFGGSMMKVIQVLFVLCQKPYEFLYMCRIMWSVKGALNFLLQSFLSTSIYRIGLQKLSI